MTPGQTLLFNVASGENTTHLSVWIDWNNNGNFNDANELVWTDGGNGPHIIPISTSGLALGSYRIRVRSQDNSVPNGPCSKIYGETEDYTLKVIYPNYYSWSPATNLDDATIPTPGNSSTYTLTVSDIFGCSAESSIEITEMALPVVDLGVDTSYCEGTAFNLTLDAQNAGAIYSWNDASTEQTFIVTTAGTYSVTVTDENNCSNYDEIAIIQNPLPSYNSLSVTSDNGICSYSFEITNPSDVNQYSWDFGDGETITQGTYTALHDFEYEGNYTITVELSNDCGTVEASTVVNCLMTGLEEQELSNLMVLYPNPASTQVTIQTPESIVIQHISIIDNLGRTIAQPKAHSTIEISELSNGFYTMILSTNSGIIQKKFEVFK